MIKPLPFIVEKNGKLELNKEVIDIVKKSVNPKFILFYGKTRLGKSTTLNQLIRGNHETWKFINKKPFNSNDSLDSVTKGCNIFGPLKITEILKRHEGLENKKIKEDFDVFFCDTEGISSLDGIQKQTIPGILTLLQICTICVFMVNKNCSTDDLKEICSHIQISKIINKKNLVTPKVTVYISNIFTGKKKDDDSEDEDDNENMDEDELNVKYKNNGNTEKQRIYDAVKQRYPNLGLDINDFEVIPGGPFLHTKNEPDHNNIRAKLYWNSIKEIFLVFLNNKGKKNEGDEIIKYIELLFNAFNKIEEINDDFNLENYLKNYLTKSFDEYSRNQLKKKLEKVKDEVKSNLPEYNKLLNDDEKAKESLNECFDKKNIELYKKIIPDKVKNFTNLSMEQYRKCIKEQIDKEFSSICEEILSDKNIYSLINDTIIQINNAQFQEDIDMNSDNIEKFWNIMYEKNKVILNDYKERTPNIFNSLKDNFISKIKNIFSELISKKELWTNYLKDKLILIQKEISQLYQKMFSKCNYQEDMEINIKKSDILFSEVFPGYKEKYFKNISQPRLNFTIEEIKKICQEEYDKIKKNKLLKYKNIESSIASRIRDKIDSYILIIFTDVEFRDKLDQNLGSKNAFLEIIPIDLQENSQLKKEEIDKIINNEIERGIKIFNEKRNNLPLFNQVMETLLTKCNKLVDDKIKELISKFHYLEEKIIFNSDTILSFLIYNPDININFNLAINETNINIKELCNKKANEYDILVKKNKPEWNKIKKEKISKINQICNNFIQKNISNAYYQDNIKNINEDELKSLILNIPDLYKGVEPYKKEEINSEIDEIIQKTLLKILSHKNSLPNWDLIKSQLIQQAYIEMLNKSRTSLGSDVNQAINILINHIENLPYFYNECKTEEKKMK